MTWTWTLMSPVELIATKRLLDERRHDCEWLALFTPDCRYWVPLQVLHSRRAPRTRAGRRGPPAARVAVERLKNPRAHSQHPPSRCQHVLQASAVTQRRRERRHLRAANALRYIESAANASGAGGSCVHRLVKGRTRWRIRLKRVNLLMPARPCRLSSCFLIHPTRSHTMNRFVRCALGAAVSLAFTAGTMAADLKVA